MSKAYIIYKEEICKFSTKVHGGGTDSEKMYIGKVCPFLLWLAYEDNAGYNKNGFFIVIKEGIITWMEIMKKNFF